MSREEKEEKRRQEDLKMMRSSLTWPRWPVLPLVDRERQASALLFANARPVIYAGSLYRLGDSHPAMAGGQGHRSQTWAEVLATCSRSEFESFEAIVAAGWEVD